MEGGAGPARPELHVLVFADLHLDRAYPWSTREAGAAARAAAEVTFEAICAIAAAEADIVVSAGDLFDQDRHLPATGELLRAGFERLSDIPVLLIPGESDPLGPMSLYDQVKWTPNVRLFRDAGAFEPVPGFSVWADPAGSGAAMAEVNPGEIRVAVVRGPSLYQLPDLDARTDVKHVVAAESHFPWEAEKTTCPGAAHPSDPGGPPGSAVVLGIAPDGRVAVTRRQLGGSAPGLPARRFPTDELEAMDLAVIGEEQTVRGEFVRNLLAPDEVTVHLRRLALLSGMRALAGRPPETPVP